MRRTRILRIVTRLNTGGPTVHLVTLSQALAGLGYEQWLVAGREGPHEGSMRAFVEAQGIQPIFVPAMVATSHLSPADAVALAQIRGHIRKLPILTLHRNNATPDKLPRMRDWFRYLDMLGITSARLHDLDIGRHWIEIRDSTGRSERGQLDFVVHCGRRWAIEGFIAAHPGRVSA